MVLRRVRDRPHQPIRRPPLLPVRGPDSGSNSGADHLRADHGTDPGTNINANPVASHLWTDPGSDLGADHLRANPGTNTIADPLANHLRADSGPDLSASHLRAVRVAGMQRGEHRESVHL